MQPHVLTFSDHQAVALAETRHSAGMHRQAYNKRVNCAGGLTSQRLCDSSVAEPAAALTAALSAAATAVWLVCCQPSCSATEAGTGTPAAGQSGKRPPRLDQANSACRGRRSPPSGAEDGLTAHLQTLLQQLLPGRRSVQQEPWSTDAATRPATWGGGETLIPLACKLMSAVEYR